MIGMLLFWHAMMESANSEHNLVDLLTVSPNLDWEDNKIYHIYANNKTYLQMTLMDYLHRFFILILSYHIIASPFHLTAICSYLSLPYSLTCSNCPRTGFVCKCSSAEDSGRIEMLGPLIVLYLPTVHRHFAIDEQFINSICFFSSSDIIGPLWLRYIINTSE